MQRHQTNNSHGCPSTQRGAALILMLVIVVMGAAATLVGSLSTTALKSARQETTAAALAQAKEALIGFAVKVQVSNSDTACADPPTYDNPNCPRPGDLPCPDMDNDGDAETNCGDASGSNQYKRLGRLPWKTLGLPDLRDGSGERLWYAVSNNFKNSTRTKCSNSNFSGCLNSDTVGTISVFGSDSNALNTGNTSTGAVAVIIAPSDALQRQDNVSQIRNCTVGVDCDIAGKCTSASPTTVPKCNPVNYLDIATVGSNTEDNANFVDGSPTNGFIQGKINDNNSNIILNDQLLVITQDNIMQPVQKRVATEVKNCLIEYASITQNNNYYPWAAIRTVVSGTATYPDTNDLYFGRI